MTGSQILDLYGAKLWNLQDLEDLFVSPLREDVRQSALDLWGSGGMLGTVSGTPTAVDTDTFTLDFTADVGGYTTLGHRIQIDASNPEWTDVPLARGAANYYLAAHYGEVPVGTELSNGGLPRWRAWEEVIGRVFTPTTVASNGSGGTLITVSADLNTGEKWEDATLTRPVVVWFSDADGNPVANTAEAIFEGDLENTSAGVYQIDVSHIFGQTSLSTTSARYRVCLLGPSVNAAASASGSWTDYVHLGTLTDPNWVPTTNVLTSFGTHVSDFTTHVNDDNNPHGGTLTQSTLNVGTLLQSNTRALFYKQVEIGAGSTRVLHANTDSGSEVFDIDVEAIGVVGTYTGGMDIDASADPWRVTTGVFGFVSGSQLYGGDGGADLDWTGSTATLSPDLVTLDGCTETKLIGASTIYAGRTGGALLLTGSPYTVTCPITDNDTAVIDLGDYLPDGVTLTSLGFNAVQGSSSSITWTLFAYNRITGSETTINTGVYGSSGSFAVSETFSSVVNLAVSGYALRLAFSNGSGSVVQTIKGAVRIGWTRDYLFS